MTTATYSIKYEWNSTRQEYLAEIEIKTNGELLNNPKRVCLGLTITPNKTYKDYVYGEDISDVTYKAITTVVEALNTLKEVKQYNQTKLNATPKPVESTITF